ncbi:MAG: 50S ribosomal protein L17 [Candidatus Omnitrophota bacterium]|nr:50S ribosomal protein L17 [Candidatus Omnitrophota bacterium]
MRHRKKHSKLSMMTSRRTMTMRNMVRGLFKHQKIVTILARAKEARRLAEKLITIAKNDTVVARRRAYAELGDRDMVARLFKEIAPLFKNRQSGYTRIIPLGFRRGDGATLAILELTEKKIVEKLPKKKTDKAKLPDEKSGAQSVKPGKPEESKKPKEEQKKEAHKEEPKIKSVPKSKPSLEEEKRHEKAKSEDRKAAGQRGFMKNLRGLFRKRGDR